MSDQVTVVSLAGLNEAFLERIRGVSPRLRVIEAGPAANAYLQARKQGSEAGPAPADDLRSLIGEGEVLFGVRFDREIVAMMPRLRWIQAMTAGVDHLGSRPAGSTGSRSGSTS